MDIADYCPAELSNIFISLLVIQIYMFLYSLAISHLKYKIMNSPWVTAYTISDDT